MSISSPSKIVCVGRNYAEHARELGNAIPEQPVLFIKPPSSLRSLDDGITWPSALGECHFECELSLRLGQRISSASWHGLSIDQANQQALAAIDGVTLGLDLTLRDLQNQLKQKGQPWERAKAFDGACLLGDWLDPQLVMDWQQVHFEFWQNAELRQQGDSADMLFGVAALLVEISQCFTLMPGDVVMTGTPAGVGPLHAGDHLEMRLHLSDGQHQWQTTCHDPIE